MRVGRIVGITLILAGLYGISRHQDTAQADAAVRATKDKSAAVFDHQTRIALLTVNAVNSVGRYQHDQQITFLKQEVAAHPNEACYGFKLGAKQAVGFYWGKPAAVTQVTQEMAPFIRMDCPEPTYGH